jgi:hypothetical protein
VAEPQICFVGVDCSPWPPTNWPYQIVTVKALDANGKVATGYTGTVTFKDPVTHAAPSGLHDQQLTKGVAYVPVRSVDLGLLFAVEPFNSKCPRNGGGVVFSVTDTANASIFGCQSIDGGSQTIVFPKPFADAPSASCPMGCFTDPTGTITIDTNFVVPNIHLPVIQPTAVTIAGGTLDGLYFTQAVTVDFWTVPGAAIVVSSRCSQCDSAYDYLVPQPKLSVLSTVELTDVASRALESEVFVSVHLIDLSVVSAWAAPKAGSGFVPVEGRPTGASDPKCYFDVLLTQLSPFCDHIFESPGP